MSTTGASQPPIATPTALAGAKNQYYHYDPSSAAAILALVTLSCTTALHMFQMLRTRTWYFVPFVVGGFLECLGYVARVINSYQTPNWTTAVFIIEELGILIAPAFLAASMYILFGRIIRLTDGDSRSLIRQKYLTAIFVCGDVLSLFTQAAGGGELASAKPDTIQLGEKIIEAGLFLQIISFGTFVLCGIAFHYRITKRPTTASTSPWNPWQKHMYTLYATSSLVFGRCIFRVVMYLQGTDGSISSSEVLVYIFDFLFIFIVMVSFNIVHPSEVHALLHGGGKIAWRGSFKHISVPSHEDQAAFNLEHGT